MLLFSTLLCFLILDWSYCQTVSDLCDKKHFLSFTHPSNRSVNYNQTTTLTDRYMREGWYGLLDFIIPSVQPVSSHCGTIYPIYLQSGPSVTGVIEDVTACIRDCKITMTIQALKCSERLTVYSLIIPTTSGAAYCLDGIETVLVNFNTTVTVNTDLRVVPGSLYNDKEFIFDCSFPNPNRVSQVYKATWFVDDVMVYESTYTDFNDANKIRSLTDTRLRNSNITTVGFQLHCDIRAAEVTNSETRSSLPSTSSKKFIGIKVLNPVINIKEGGTARIEIRSDVPIGCSLAMGCDLSVTADIPKGDEDACEPTPTANGVCGISIKTLEWGAMYQLDITSTVTEDYGQTFTQKKVFLRTETHHLPQPIWGNYFLEPVTINIAKDTSLIRGKSCKIYNDPYLIDFYSRWNSFQVAGTFYLLQLDNVEVQVQITSCSGATWYLGSDSCVCGVVVRVGRTAFMINRCNLGYWYIDYILCDDGGDILDVKKKTESMFEMSLPSDTKIQIKLREWTKYNWLNIYIYPSVRDVGKTSGLCGELTATPPTVDYNEAYYNSWRVENDVRLFNPDNWRTLPEWTPTTDRFQHCSCHQREEGTSETTLNCSPVPGATTCSLEEDYTLFHKKRCTSPRRKKRSLPRGSQSQILHHRRLKRDVSWKNGWTINSAGEYCSGLFNNSMVITRCEGINGINIEGAIETCISDIQLSGTDAFALSSISSVSSQCLREARMNGTLREEKVENGKTILEIVEEVACPGECSDQGLCEDGKCICNSGYIGSDCSLSVNTPPLADKLEADGHCDLSEDDCTEVAVFGGRFVDADQTKCKLLPFKIKNDQITVSEETEIQTAVFESIGEVTCKLPSRNRSVDVPVIDETVTGYKVSVSNNAQNYSQQLNFIIYNTECINCSIDSSDEIICAFSPDHCTMNGICYNNGTMYNIGDREFLCRADSSGKVWFQVINGTEIEVTEDPLTSEIPGTTMGGVTDEIQLTTEVTGTTINTVANNPSTVKKTDYVVIGISVIAVVVFTVI